MFLCVSRYQDDYISRTKLIKVCTKLKKSSDSRISAAATDLISLANIYKRDGKQLDTWKFSIHIRGYFRKLCFENNCIDSYEKEYTPLILQIENSIWPYCQKR
jgi:hypothetical protein